MKTVYGARGDGSSDDTAALQRAINDLGTGGRYVLYLPAGTYRITSTLRMVSKLHVGIVGENPTNTIIQYDGPSGADMLYANGARYSKWWRITWNGAGRAASAINHAWDGSTLGAATALDHVDEVFQDVGIGIRAGSFKPGNYQDAEASVVRSKFIRCSQAGLSIESWNALDWWVRDSEFIDNNIGATNTFGAGNFHVYGSVFRNSRVADVAVTHNLYFSLRNNTSINSKKFLTGGNIGRNNENITLQNNKIITPVDSVAVLVENLGPLVMIDNSFQSRPGQSGPVVVHRSGYPDVETISVGNKFTVSNPIDSSSPRRISVDDQVTSLSLTVPSLPPAAPKQNRRVFEVPAGASASVIQQAINEAAALNGQRPVVHLPAGSYSIASTITIPANADLQLVGDSEATALNWTGGAGGRMFYLAGPNRSVLRELSIRLGGNADGVHIEGADQPGARILTRQIYANGAYTHNLLAENLNYAKVDMQDYLHYYNGSVGSIKVAGGGASGGRVAVLGGMAGGHGMSGVMYDVTGGGKLLVYDCWYEGYTPTLFNLRDSGTVTFSGSIIAPYYNISGTGPAFQVDGFRGKVTIVNSMLQKYGVVQNENSATNVLLLGMDNRNTGTLQRPGGGGNFGLISSHEYNGTSGWISLPNIGVSDANFIRSQLQQMRDDPQETNTAVIPGGVTDVQMYRIAIESPRIGMKVSSTGTVAPPPPPPAAVPPTVAVTSPANGTQLTAPSTLAITANASDSDGQIQRVEFYAGSTLVGSDTAAPYAVTWNQPPAGTYNLKAVATDSQGLTATCTQVTVTVNPATVPPPSNAPGIVTAGLRTWLRADAGLTMNGAGVSQWADQSGRGVHAIQATAASQPTVTAIAINGKPALKFDGAADFLTFNLPLNGLAGMTVFLVSASEADPDGTSIGVMNAPLFWNETASWGTMHVSPFQSRVKFRFGSTQAGNLPVYTRPASVGTGFTLTAALKNAAMEYLYVDGKLVLTQTGKFTNINGIDPVGNLGRGYGNSYFNGQIAEVLVYDRALTDSERQGVETYLLQKYFGTPATPVATIPSNGLAKWFKADTGITLSGSTVSRWADQSTAKADAVQATAASQPTLVANALNGKPVVRFDGANDFLTFSQPLDGLTGMTMFLVSASAMALDGSSIGVTSAPLFWDETAGWGQVHLSPFQGVVKYRFGTTWSNNLPSYARPASIGNKFSATMAMKNGATETLYVNGQLVQTVAGKGTTLAGINSTGNLGRGYSNSYFPGDIAEVIVYNRALTDAERQQVEQYLKAKYNCFQ